jgi:tRNA A37 threonylcarbamoyladenosine modification protein TsaB
MKDPLGVFLDVSLSTLQGCVFRLSDSHIIKAWALELTHESPLSEILPSLWRTQFQESAGSVLFQKVSHLYVLQGPGALTSLRVLFAHLVAIQTAFPHIRFQGVPTPVLLNRMRFGVQSESHSFVMRVGRFAFISGQCLQPSTYRTFRLVSAEDWQGFTAQLEGGVCLFLGALLPPQLSPSNLEWIHQGFALSPQRVLEHLDCFTPVGKLLPVQP